MKGKLYTIKDIEKEIDDELKSIEKTLKVIFECDCVYTETKNSFFIHLPTFKQFKQGQIIEVAY